MREIELEWRNGAAALRLIDARGFARLRGLIGRRPLRGYDGMFFSRCGSVHGFWMHRPLDVVFLDSDLRALEVTRLQPWRVITALGASSTIELEEGECARRGIVAGTAFKKSFCKRGGKKIDLVP